jgi:hypothetical protein
MILNKIDIFLDFWVFWLILLIVLVFVVRWASYYLFGEKEREEERERKGYGYDENLKFWDKYDVLSIVVRVFFVVLILATIKSCLGG